MSTKFIQFSNTPNCNKYFNINAINKIIKISSDEWGYEERLLVHIQDEEPFVIAPSHPHWKYLLSLMEDFPNEHRE